MTKARRWDNSEWPAWLLVAWNMDRHKEGALKCLPAEDRIDGKCDLHIVTLEGCHDITFDDWIIQGVNGEIYPCKPDIFEKTYDLVIV